MPKPIAAVLIAAVANLAVHAQGTRVSSPKSIPPPGSKAPVAGYTIVRSFPHDPGAYTQGLEYFDGFLYEGTGLKGRSAVRKV